MKRMGVAGLLLLTLVLSCCPLRAQQTPSSSTSSASAPSSDSSKVVTEKLNQLDQRVAAAQSSADNAWMLMSAALVLMMTGPGLALFYGGLVRKKNVLATLMQSFACTCLVTILWWVIGYSWAFTPGNGFMGGTSRAWFSGVAFVHGDTASRLTVSHLAPTIPETAPRAFRLTKGTTA